MKFGVIVTGQIRDQRIFKDLLVELNACRKNFTQIIFSSWSDQIAIAKKIMEDLNLPIEIQYCDCGYIFPIQLNSNRNLVSFFAQFQQIAEAKNLVSGKSGHLIRLRADFDARGNLGRFVNSLDFAFKKNPTKKSLLFGGCGIPFFFEDRILVVSLIHYKRLVEMSVAQLFGYDRNNLFPEVMFFTAMVGATGQHVRHDFRHRQEMSKFGLYAEYDVSVFGKHFSAYVDEYLALVFENFIFFEDFLKNSERVEACEELKRDFLPQFQYAYDESSYRIMWAKEKEAYEETALNLARDLDRSVASRDDAQQEKVAYEELQRNYWAGNGRAVIALYEKTNFQVFESSALAFYACSLFVEGLIEKAVLIFCELLDSNCRTYEYLFYYVRYARSIGDRELARRVLERVADFYPNDQRLLPEYKAWLSESAVQ